MHPRRDLVLKKKMGLGCTLFQQEKLAEVARRWAELCGQGVRSGRRSVVKFCEVGGALW